MTFLLISADDDASESLRVMLERAGQVVRRTANLVEAQARWSEHAAAVVVADSAIPGVERFLERTRRQSPWTRVLMMLDAGSPLPRTLLATIPKPFDACELAEILCREVELARAERDRAALERELEHSERLASIGRIAASMAHEINNPLSVVRASAEYAREVSDRYDDAELRASAEDLELAVDRIRSFVDHVCGFARRERSELTEAPLKHTIDIALRMIRPRARARAVQLAVEGDFHAKAAHDPPRLSQAILNVLSNAIDAAADGGKKVRLRVVENPTAVIIQVDDDGPGIAAFVTETLFEPFVTTKPPGHGTGLGLAITRQIMVDHGGRVELTPRREGGARAELVLPIGV